MATSKLLIHLRRNPLFSSLRTASYVLRNSICLSLLSPPSPHFSHNTLRPHPPSLEYSIAGFHSFRSRSFSTRLSEESQYGDETAGMSELVNVGLSEVNEGLGGGSGEELSLPVRTLISILDEYHDYFGLPWWVIIASSTLAMRIAVFPVLVLQLHKMKRIAELFPKLPSLFPPPLSGRRYIDQILFFRKERRAMGCPSYLWIITYSLLQVPCFFLWMNSIRRMSLDHHPGFECGGALWFQDLTAVCHDKSGLIFPFLIACLHYINVKISFVGSSVGKVTDLFGLLVKLYKFYLDILTVPIFFIGCCIPQGSLIYWLTNSLLSVVQQLSLKHPAVRAKLGLPDKDAQAAAANSEELETPAIAFLDSPTNQFKSSVHNLSPKELLTLSVQLLSEGHEEKAVPLLRLALDKDPEYTRALIVMGQTLLRNGQEFEATEYFERAISKLFLHGHPTEVEEVDLLILASQWAGVACIRQGKITEGIGHLAKVTRLKEPEDPISKAHYFDGLVLLASALFRVGRKAEAATYLRLAVVYNPAYNEFLEQCEKDEDDAGFVSDLVRSRRWDY